MTSKGHSPHVNFPLHNHINGEVDDRPEDIDAQSLALAAVIVAIIGYLPVALCGVEVKSATSPNSEVLCLP